MITIIIIIIATTTTTTTIVIITTELTGVTTVTTAVTATTAKRKDYSQVPNKRGGGSQNKRGWREISENCNKRGDGNFMENLINCRKSGRATKQGSHDTAGRACCGVRFLAGNFAPKMHARKHKVLAEYLLFLFWPVIHYRT